MAHPIEIFGDKGSGNCLKVLYAAQYVGRDFVWRDVNLLAGETRTDAFLKLNPAGQVPCAVLHDGRTLAQSNAIIGWLAEGSDLIPTDAFARAKMYEWLFWEQYSHEPVIAVRRFKKVYLKLADADIDPSLLSCGYSILGVMEQRLSQAQFLAGDGFSIADIALVAYTRLAHEGGFDLARFPAIQAWVARCERALNLASVTELV